MGIPRWTQDLTPYLEPGAITTTPDNGSRLVIRNIVIDGPSLVYHVYNALALSSNTIAAGSLNEPTYIQLNSAIDVFLTDLESCGAKIERIFFDGALPHSKRNTRLDRMEKSRLQLERLKVLGPPPRPLNLPGGLDRDQLSILLWQTKAGSSGSSSFVGPFIVPSVIEYLSHSKWKNALAVVNGEAEASCASIAKATSATVLSNDSDLTLLADMQDGQSVGLLRSMSMQRASEKVPPVITVQCWRPKHIATRLGVQNLLRVGFERSKDSTISFATVLQRAQDEKNKQNIVSTDFNKFADQFKAVLELEATMEMGYDLNHLDPRVAELVCQLTDVNKSSAAARNKELWVTLPILLEDPSKDSSWSYGHETRRLAYSLLCSTYGTVTKHTQAITESSRKGPRIAQDMIQTIHSTKLGDTIRSFVTDLVPLPQFAVSSASPGTNIPRESLLWALASVLKHRTAAGKNAIPLTIVQEYLGLNHRSSQTSKKAHARNHEREWQLVHLNANVHSVLYSLRVLRQACIVLHGSNTIVDYKDDFVRLVELLQPMPTIQDLMLDVEKINLLMRQSPLSKSDRAFKDIEPYIGHFPHAHPLPKVDDITGYTIATSKKDGKRNKKRRLASTEHDEQSNTQLRGKVSTNPFDLLIGRG